MGRKGDESMVREVLGWIADKWTLVVLEELDGGVRRFNELRRRVGGISQKMLTQTLRQMERNGLVSRQVYAEVPPRVEYRLTPSGRSLGGAVCSVWRWTERHAAAIHEARRRNGSA